MRKLLLILMLCALPGLAKADALNVTESLKKIKFDAGVGYDFHNKQVVNTETINIFGYKGINLSAGYSTKDVALVAISYEIVRLKNLGVTVPILDLVKIEPFAYYGLGSLNMADVAGSRPSYGAGVKLIDITF